MADINNIEKGTDDLNFNVNFEETNSQSSKTTNDKIQEDAFIQEQQQKAKYNQDQEEQKNIQQTKETKESQPEQKNLTTCVFCLLFKIFALLCYYLIPTFSDKLSLSFISVILFVCFDFWVIKNVAGRLLVGLRWWNQIQEDGSSLWLFESQEAHYQPNSLNSTIFWISQILFCIFWLLQTIFSIILLRLLWVLLALVSLALVGINFMGFYKCRGQHQKKAKELMMKVGVKLIE